MADDSRRKVVGSDHLVQLRKKVDSHFKSTLQRDPKSFSCSRGCDSCCHRKFSVFEVEAKEISIELRRISSEDRVLREKIREQANTAPHCAMLVDGLCQVYSVRPLICRSHGLAIAHTSPDDPEELVVSHCPLNYQESTPQPQDVLLLDAVNRPLVLIAELQGLAGRVELSSLAAAPDGA